MQKIKITKKLLNILRSYTKLFGRIESEYMRKVSELEKMMQHETGIKDIEFVFCDGECSGIGTPVCPEKMDLIRRDKLEK